MENTSQKLGRVSNLIHSFMSSPFHEVNSLSELYNEKEILLEDWFDEYQDKYPELRKKFEKYLNNKENDETMNSIKDEIKLLMYNNRQQKE